MRGEKTIDLGVTFRYPNGKGQYEETSAVTVRAPGLSMFHVHTRMQAWVVDGLVGAMNKVVREKGAEQARADAAAEADADQQAEQEEHPGDVIMDRMAIGLGERYPDFAVYIKKVLTNSALVSVGAGGRMTDEAWEAIEAEAGMQGVLVVLGTFAGFFLGSGPSKKPNGNASSTISSSDTKAALMPPGPKKRHLSS
jgi:hypothetical protein